MDTHNPLLDSILTRKYEEATRQGVSVYFDLCDLRDFPLSGVDMVTVLANLLDNAICAAAQAYPPEVYVRVRKTEEEYLLSVRNRVQKDLELVELCREHIVPAAAAHGITCCVAWGFPTCGMFCCATARSTP